MPQTDIAYDTPYNRKIVSLLKELDEKHWKKAYPEYTPTPFGQRIGSYHGDLAGQMVGGGSSPMKYNPAGNGAAYPPYNLSSGLAVHSGGGYAGIDGAVGMGHPALEGGRYNVSKFVKDLGKISKAVGLKQVLKPIAKAATHKAVTEIEGAGEGGALSGGKKYGVSNFVKDLGKISKAVGLKQVLKPVAKAASQKAVTEIAAAGRKGGKYSAAKFAKDLGKISKAVGLKQVLKPIAKAASAKAVTEIQGAGRGRGARAAIVKKVMAEKGLSLPQASKYVKEHGLY